MTTPRWYARPDGDGIELRRAPRLASWNKVGDPEQLLLRRYLDDTAELLSPSAVDSGPWALRLDVGLPPGRDLLDMADLDNYAYPLATRMGNERLVSVWSAKRHADASCVHVAPAHETVPPDVAHTVRTTASAQRTAYKEQIRSALAGAPPIPPGPVQLQIAFVVGARRNWINLWKPTIDALDPLLGRTRPDRDWHPNDGRITEFALHVNVDPALQHDVVASIIAAPARTERIAP